MELSAREFMRILLLCVTCSGLAAVAGCFSHPGIACAPLTPGETWQWLHRACCSGTDLSSALVVLARSCAGFTREATRGCPCLPVN